jgi:hypothetical protein
MTASVLTDLLLEQGEWQVMAACRGVSAPDLFFEQNSETARGRFDPDIRNAVRTICATCPVRLTCLEAGMNEAYGLWGGLLAAERLAIKRRRDEIPVLRRVSG